MSARIEMMLSGITVGPRVRKDYGDLSTLIRSIQELGLLQPIGVTAEGQLVFGGRRLEALRRLGYTTVPVRVLSTSADAVTELRAELDENVERHPLSPVEAADLRRRIKSMHGPVTDQPAPVEDLVQVVDAEMDVADEQLGFAADQAGSAVDEQEEPVADEEEPAEPDGVEDGAAALTADESPTDPATDEPFDHEDEDEELQLLPVRAAAREVERQVSAATGYSTTTLKRVDRIQEFTVNQDAGVAAAAERALEAIGAGAPVKPQLDAVIETQQVARALQVYPGLSHIKSDAKHVLRMEAFLNDVQETGGEEAVAAEIEAMEAMWGDESAASVSVEERESAYEFNSSLAEMVERWKRGSGASTVARVIPNLPDVAVRSWAALARDLRDIAEQITDSIPD